MLFVAKENLIKLSMVIKNGEEKFDELDKNVAKDWASTKKIKGD